MSKNKVVTKKNTPSSTKENFQQQSIRPTYFLLGILLLTILVFSNSLTGNFTSWDDMGYVVDNPFIKDLSWDGIKKMFASPYMGNYHPLTCLSNAIEYKIWGLNPVPFHIFNLVFHLLNTILVFRFVVLLTKRLQVSAIIAILFAIHPMHVESVSWISERKDVLYAFFYLLSLIYYIKWREEKELKGYMYWAALLFFLFSLLSKSMAVTLPLVLILIDFYKKYTPDFSFSKILNWGKVYFPFFILSVLFGVVAMNTQTEAMDSTEKFSLIDKFFFLSYELVVYVLKLIAPIHLSALHPYPVKIDGLLPFEYYFSALVFILVVFCIYKFKRKAENNTWPKDLIFGILFFVITISIVLQVVPIGYAIIAERYTYIPYVGLLLGIVLPLYNMSGKKRSYLTVLFIGYVVIFSILSFNRNKVWANSTALFSDIIEKYPKIGSAYLNRGQEKYKLQDYRGAIEDYNKAITNVPTYFEAHYNRGLAKYLLKDYQGALDDYNKAIGFYSRLGMVYYIRGLVKSDLQDFKGAIADYDKAIELNFTQKDVHWLRGNLKFNLGDFKGAIRDYDYVIEKKSGKDDVYNQRALSKHRLQDYPGAIKDYDIAASLNPNNSNTFMNRGIIKGMQLDYQGAINDFDKVIKINPKESMAYYNRGYAKINLKNIEEACIDLKIALSLGYEGANQFIQVYCK